MEKLLLLGALLLPGVLCALPTDFVVRGYDLNYTLTSDLSATVAGTVVVQLQCVTSTNKIVLHWGSSLSSALRVSQEVIVNTSATAQPTDPPTTTTITAITAAVNTTTQQLTITRTDTNFDTTNMYVNVTIHFQTRLNQDNKGLFYRQYQIENNQQNALIMTNLGPTFSREVFPCLDEPQLAGVIQLNLTFPSTWDVGATTAVQTSAADTVAGTTSVIFNSITTPPNKFAFFIAQNMTKTPFPQSSYSLVLWARKGLDSASASASARFLLGCIYSLEAIMGTSWPLGQLNVVMVPGLEEPFAGYGVIFIREENYAQDYINPRMEGLFKATVAPVVYQLVRQYTEFSSFPKSWSDYWVSQAIGRYSQFLIMNMVVPAFDFKTDLEVARQNALYLDSQLNSKPLNDTSVNNLLDPELSTYVQSLVSDPLKSLKGAAILNMMDQTLPAGFVFNFIKTFISGNIGKEISAYQFTTTFLSQAQSSALVSSNAKTALANTLGYWFNSTQYALETVRVAQYANETSTGSVTLTTSAFCSVFNPGCVATLPANFYVAATVGSRSDSRYYQPRQDFWPNNVATGSSVATSLDVMSADWVVANMNSGGYYRSNYESVNWERIITAFSSNDNSLMSRSQLLDDAFALSLSTSETLNYNITLRLAMANLGNTQYKNWVPVRRGLQEISNTLMGLNEYASYKSFAAGYYLNLNGFLQNSTIDPFERARILGLFLDEMCEYDITGYRVSAVGNLTAMLTGTLPSTVPSSAYDGLACCGARYNSTLKGQTLWNILSNSTLSYYRRRYASIALGCLSNYADVAQYYDTMANANIQLKPYIQIALENVADKNPFAFLTNFTQRISRFQSQLGSVSVASLITRAGRKISTSQASVLDNLPDVDGVVNSAVQTTKSVISSKTTWLSSNNRTLVTALQTNTFPTSAANIVTAMSLLLIMPFLMIVLAPLSV